MVPLMFLLWLAPVAVLIALAAYAIWYKRRHGAPKDLRGDWWSGFEAEFRAYARGWEGSSRSKRPAQRGDVAEGL
jgi:hypothetical protein